MLAYNILIKRSYSGDSSYIERFSRLVSGTWEVHE